MFSINAANGVLTSLGATVAAGDTPIAIAVDPLGRFAYAPNLNTNTISMYAINATTGVLSPIGTGSVAAGTHPIAIAIDPSGKFLYASNNGSSNISLYSINATTGALSPIGAGTIASGGSGPDGVTVDPSGRFLYVGNDSGSVANFSLDPGTRALPSLRPPVFAGTSSQSLSVH